MIIAEYGDALKDKVWHAILFRIVVSTHVAPLPKYDKQLHCNRNDSDMILIQFQQRKNKAEW